MARITEDHFSSLEQDRVTPDRVTGETRVRRQFLNNHSNAIQLVTIGYAVTGFTILFGGQSAKQGDKTGSEERHANHGPQRNRPMHDQVGPKKRKDKEVSPGDDLDVVPFPGSELHEVAKQENSDGRKEEYQASRHRRAGSAILFPSPSSSHSYRERQG